MGKKVESFLSDDGVLFTDEYAMLKHEATIAITQEFPELKISMGTIMPKAERLAEILEPLATYCRINHPRDPEPETTLEVVRAQCKAVQYSDMMECKDCDQRWDTNDSFPPPCKPPVAVEKPACNGCGNAFSCTYPDC